MVQNQICIPHSPDKELDLCFNNMLPLVIVLCSTTQKSNLTNSSHTVFGIALSSFFIQSRYLYLCSLLSCILQSLIHKPVLVSAHPCSIIHACCHYISSRAKVASFLSTFLYHYPLQCLFFHVGIGWTKSKVDFLLTSFQAR